MKTIPQIKAEIQGIERQLKSGEYESKSRSAMYKKIDHLRACILYLETAPNAEFVRNELKRLDATINNRCKVIDEFFSTESYQKMTKPALTKLRKEHEKQNDLPKLRTQLDTLNYLLS
jgi:hypothetical protein